MYSYRKRPEGYGICGAKNIYSSNVKIGNWNEDIFGEFLASNPRQCDPIPESTIGSCYKPLKDRQQPPPISIKMLKPYELLIKHKEGTVRTILNNPDVKSLSKEEMYLTVNRETFARDERLKSYQLPEKSLEAKKIKQFKQDIEDTYHLTTEIREANKFTSQFIPKPTINPQEVIGVTLPHCQIHKVQVSMGRPPELHLRESRHKSKKTSEKK